MTLTRRDLLALAAAVPAFSSLARARLPKSSHVPLPSQPLPDDEAAWERIKNECIPTLLAANPEVRVKLDIDDWLFFFGRN